MSQVWPSMIAPLVWFKHMFNELAVYNSKPKDNRTESEQSFLTFASFKAGFQVNEMSLELCSLFSTFQ